jgi:hypothetical protein
VKRQVRGRFRRDPKAAFGRLGLECRPDVC